MLPWAWVDLYEHDICRSTYDHHIIFGASGSLKDGPVSQEVGQPIWDDFCLMVYRAQVTAGVCVWPSWAATWGSRSRRDAHEKVWKSIKNKKLSDQNRLSAAVLLTGKCACFFWQPREQRTLYLCLAFSFQVHTSSKYQQSAANTRILSGESY